MMKYARSFLLLILCSCSFKPSETVGTDLGGGIVTRTDVERYAALSLDIRDIDELIRNTRDGDAALDLYKVGRNAESDQPDVKFSVQKMTTSLRSLPRSQQTPAYLFQLFGLADRDIDKLNPNYADNFALSRIRPGSNLASTGLVALHSWMYASHVLFRGIDICRRISTADNPGIFQLRGGGMDEFIAVWIGKGQTPASDEGYGMYALAQRAASLFGQISPSSPEAPVNKDIKLLYQAAVQVLALPNACSRSNSQSVGQLWELAGRIQSKMYVPLMQLLIDAVVRQDADDAALYATALVPQTVQCRPSIYKRLKESLIDGTTSLNRLSSVVEDLQGVYDCLGFTCEDIGTYGAQVPQCNDPPINFPLAEYTPSTNVVPVSKIDLDILQIGILSRLQSYSFVSLLYTHGRNSVRKPRRDGDPFFIQSLRNMATTNARRAADPFFTLFVQYHNDQNYADSDIFNALNGLGKWGTGSPDQRAALIASTCSYQIVYMYALAEMADALADCQKGDVTDNRGAAHAWDEVAALLIGSLEGNRAGGSSDLEDGQLLWNLANQRAFQFNTLNEEGFSRINSELEDLLFAGKAEMNSLSCDNLKRTIDRIQHLILLPIIQSTIRYAIINQQQDRSSSADLVQGESFALAVLPVVHRYDTNSASLIEENMVIRQGVPPVSNGAQAVADAFFAALDDFGYSCDLVGATSEADACLPAGGLSRVRPTPGTPSGSSGVAFLPSCILSIFLAWLNS